VQEPIKNIGLHVGQGSQFQGGLADYSYRALVLDYLFLLLLELLSEFQVLFSQELLHVREGGEDAPFYFFHLFVLRF
jgi:hypothetical protein